MEKKQENKIELALTPEISAGNYSNFAAISHSPSEVVFDFIFHSPNMPQARVQSRIIMTPENAKALLFALRDNIAKYEQTFGEIQRKVPVNNTPKGGIPNPFEA